MLDIPPSPENSSAAATVVNRATDEDVLATSAGLADDADRSWAGNRWPREETIALLKVRSGMDTVFRDASLKAPLWEEVSRLVRFEDFLFVYRENFGELWFARFPEVESLVTLCLFGLIFYSVIFSWKIDWFLFRPLSNRVLLSNLYYSLLFRFGICCFLL